MRWARAKFSAKPRDPLEGRKSPGRKGGTAGPGKRWGHTCNSVKNGRSLYVFGGYGKDNRQTNDVHVFDTGKQTWSKPMVKGTPPSPRDSHSCTTVGMSLYVFGGTDGKSPLRDLHILDTISNTWLKPHIEGDGPDPREGHSAALIGTNLYIFGGCGKTADDTEELYFNDLYILDTVKMAWTKAVTRGTPPAPRDSHTCSAWNNKLIVLGGEDASDSYLSDVHLLDTDTMEWKELQASGQMLMPRAGHATVSVGKHVFVFGGFTDERKLFDDLHMLNIETGVWTKVDTTGAGPSARFSVAGDCIDVRSGILVFIGGCNGNLEALDDMYYLDTEMQAEKGQDERPEKFSLRKELKRKRQENQLVVKSPEAENRFESQMVVKSPEEEELPPPTTKELLPPPVEQKPRVTPNTFPTSPVVVPTGDKFSLYEFKPVEEKIFEAKITDVFHYGYTIESNIEGKLLRGLLFSYKPGFAHAVHAYLTRKKLSSDPNAGKAKDGRKTKLKIARGTKNTVPDGQLVPSSHTTAGDGHGVATATSTPKQQVTIPNQYQAYIPQQPPQQVQMQLQTSPPAHQHYQPRHQLPPPQQHQYSPLPSSQPQHSLPLSQPQPPPRVPMSSPTGVMSQGMTPRHFMGAGAPGYVGLPPPPSSQASPHQASGQAGLYGMRPLPPPSQQGMQLQRDRTLQTDQ